MKTYTVCCFELDDDLIPVHEKDFKTKIAAKIYVKIKYRQTNYYQKVIILDEAGKKISKFCKG